MCRVSGDFPLKSQSVNGQMSPEGPFDLSHRKGKELFVSFKPITNYLLGHLDLLISLQFKYTDYWGEMGSIGIEITYGLLSIVKHIQFYINSFISWTELAAILQAINSIQNRLFGIQQPNCLRVFFGILWMVKHSFRLTLRDRVSVEPTSKCFRSELP